MSSYRNLIRVFAVFFARHPYIIKLKDSNNNIRIKNESSEGDRLWQMRKI